MNGLGDLLFGLVGSALMNRMAMSKQQADHIANPAGALALIEANRPREPFDERLPHLPGVFGTPSGGVRF